MAERRRRRRKAQPKIDSLETRLSPNVGIDGPGPIVYSDPKAPPEPDPGPYPGDDPPIEYPTPVPGGPAGPAYHRPNMT